jgi:thiol:disulfide interchange protein
MAKYLRQSLILFFLLVYSTAGFTQIISPPKWNIQIEEKDFKVGDEVKLVFKAQIPKDWYIYSNDFDPDLGPMLTELTLSKSEGIELVGSLKAINPRKKYDEIWEGDVTYFIGNGTFEQQIKITTENINIVGSIDYQMCTDVTGQCIPFEEDFTLKTSAKPSSASTPSQESEEKVDEPSNPEVTETEEAEGPKTLPIPDPEERTYIDINEDESQGGLLGFMFIAFLAGLAALLTPCVFPMIPMTVTFFTGRSKSRISGIRNASIYGLSIIAIYTIAGTAVAAIQGPEFANWLSTHWAPNVFFFLIFIFFAFAFLGMFELTFQVDL